MNKIIVLLLGALGGLGVLSLPAHAQSLSDALEQAWQRHPQALAMTLRQAEYAARADVAASVTPGAPTVSLSNLNDRVGLNRGKQEWEIELAVPLWLPGQKAARMAEADSAQNELAARRRALRLQLAGDVREAWWALAAARNQSDLAQQRTSTARALETNVLRRFKVGELARTDANLAQTERLSAQAESVTTQAALRLAEQSYQQLTGLPAPALLPAENATFSTASSQTINQTTDPAHAQLAAATAAVQLAEAKLRLAEVSRRDAPELALRMVRDRAGFAESSANAYANSIGIKLTIPFSSGPRIRQENAAARAELAQAEAELRMTQMKLELERLRAGQDLAAAGQQLPLAQQQRALTADNLHLAEKSFALGESDLPAVLRARAAAYESESFLSRQQVSLAAAQSHSKQIMGELP
ncbi:TolC family protein [soil metagenome]